MSLVPLLLDAMLAPHTLVRAANETLPLVSESADGWYIKAALPGLTASDVSVDVTAADDDKHLWLHALPRFKTELRHAHPLPPHPCGTPRGIAPPARARRRDTRATTDTRAAPPAPAQAASQRRLERGVRQPHRWRPHSLGAPRPTTRARAPSRLADADLE